MGASFLLGHCGLFNPPQLEQAAAYIQAWTKKLKDDKSQVVKAAGQAQTVTNFRLSHEENEDKGGD